MHSPALGPSARALRLPASPLRQLLASAQLRPHLLNLAGGIPDPELFPMEAFSHAARDCILDARVALQYMPSEGDFGLRAWLRDRLLKRGWEVPIERILITAGGQNGLALAAQLLCGQGARAFVESPGYPGAHQAFALSEAELVPLTTTKQGWHLPSDLRRGDVVSVSVACQNPTGRTASASAVSDLARAARDADAWIVEDDAYGELGFSGSAIAPVSAQQNDRSILVGSLSKVLAPGLRIGYLVVPERLVTSAVRLIQAGQLQASSLSQRFIVHALLHLDFDAHLGKLRRVYETRMRTMSEILAARHIAHTSPDGGLFIWAEVEDATTWTQALLQRGVLAVPEVAFAARNVGDDGHVRLSYARFGATDPADCARLSRALSTGEPMDE